MRKINWPAVICAAAMLLLPLSGCGTDESSASDSKLISSSGKLEESSAASESLPAGARPETPPEESSSESQPSAPSQGTAQTGAVPAGDWRLVLINAANPIEKELDIELDTVQNYKVDARMAPALREMLAAAEADGIRLQIISGYRTMERSGILYENEVQSYISAGYSLDDARAEAAKWVAPPGTSEHHSGLAVDILSLDYYSHHSGFTSEFENDPEGIWLRENAPDYGFVLRYPKDKTEVTGIGYEPWHFRYVGVEHAKAITEAGLCLEEYLNG